MFVDCRRMSSRPTGGVVRASSRAREQAGIVSTSRSGHPDARPPGTQTRGAVSYLGRAGRAMPGMGCHLSHPFRSPLSRRGLGGLRLLRFPQDAGSRHEEACPMQPISLAGVLATMSQAVIPALTLCRGQAKYEPELAGSGLRCASSGSPGVPDVPDVPGSGVVLAAAATARVP
jgi:hypothetical protein